MSKHIKGSFMGKKGLCVESRGHEDGEKILRKFNRLIKQENIMIELREREFYVKPGDKKRRAQKEARARHLKEVLKKKLEGTL